jgi:DNA polymerase III subunit epsilon
MFRPITIESSGAGAPGSTPAAVEDTPDFVAIDVETACSRVSSICQIGIVGFRAGQITFEYETLLDPRDHFSSFNTRIHGITADRVIGQPCFGDVHEHVETHLAGRLTVAHSFFDKGALAAACRAHDRAVIDSNWLDSVRVAKQAWPQLPSHKLKVVAEYLGIPLNHHDALSDARAAGLIVVRATEATGRSLQDWAAPPARRRMPPAPLPSSTGPLTGHRLAILGQPRHGPIAHRIAAAGGRVVSAVGKTTSILVVTEEEPFGYVRYEAAFRAAQALQRAGGSIKIMSGRALEEMLNSNP